MSKATIILKDDEWFEVESPYSENLVTAYKQIHHSQRYWSPDDKRWGFKMEHLADIRQWVTKTFSEEPEVIKGLPDPLKDQAKIMKEFIRDVKLEMLNPEEIKL